MKQDNDIGKDMAMIFLLIICCISLGVMGVLWYQSYQEPRAIILSDCDDLGLRDTAGCLEKYIAQYYSYHIRNDDPNRSIEDILNNGGDCFDYNNLYVKLASRNGFGAKLLELELTDGSGHVFTVINNDEGYCILDQLIVHCFIYNREQTDG